MIDHTTGPLVSVIVPCYNHARFLPETVESVRMQTAPDWECLIIDDGSTDDSPKVAQALARDDRRIRFFQQTNQGPSVARNRGIAESRGRYLVFLDADDLLHPDALRWHLEAMADREDTLGIMRVWVFVESAAEVLQEYSPPAVGALLPSWIHLNPVPPLAYFCPRELIGNRRFFDLEKQLVCEDWDFWLQLAFAGAKLVIVPKTGAYYRIHPGNRSKSDRLMLEGTALVIARAHQFCIRDPRLLAQWGNDVVTKAFRTRRQLLLSFPQSGACENLTAVIDDFRAKGFRFGRSRKAMLLERLLGNWSEKLIVRYLRWIHAPWRNLRRVLGSP